MDTRGERIVPLDELSDFRVADGDPDVRGWDVVAADGVKIGEVDNLLVDMEAMKVRYLDVDVTPDLLEDTDYGHVLIPIGYARLVESPDQVLVDLLDSATLRGVPAYRNEPRAAGHESAIRDRFDDHFVQSSTDGEPGPRDAFDDERFYRARRGRGSAASGAPPEVSGRADEMALAGDGLRSRLPGDLAPSARDGPGRRPRPARRRDRSRRHLT